MPEFVSQRELVRFLDDPKADLSAYDLETFGERADIDVDYRSRNPFKGEGHNHPSNSDVRSNRGGISNYQRHIDRWPGLRRWWK